MNTPNKQAAGFTLIELLVVLGILTGFLAMLVQFVDSGVRLFDEGEAGQMLADRAEAARVAVERELRAISADARRIERGLPEDRFLVQRLGLGLPSKISASDPKGFVLRAGVSLPPVVEERLTADAMLLKAAIELGAQAEAQALQDRARQLQTTQGLRGRGRILMVQYPTGADAGLVELRIGRFLVDETLPVGEDRVVDPFLVPVPGLAELPSLLVHAHTEPLVQDLLFADLQMWSQTTTDWNAQGTAGPDEVWDSARGGWLSDPAFGPMWRMDRGEDSLDDPTDDVHPRALRVTLVVAQPNGRPAEGLLDEAIEADSTVVSLVNGDRFPGALDGGFAKIEGEWIRYAERVGDELRGCRRGQRGTRAATHSASSIVRVGRTVEFTVTLGHGKDDWNG